ncbi:MAG: hypothetical protein ACJA1E_000059 [Paracoccaceae bacterium]
MPGTANVVGEGLHPDPDLGLGRDLGPDPHEADDSHKCAAHVIDLRAKDMLDPDPQCGFGAVALPGLPGQRLAPLASLAMGGECGWSASWLLAPLRSRPTDRRHPPDPGTGVSPRQQLIHRLTAMHGSIGEAASIARLGIAKQCPERG